LKKKSFLKVKMCFFLGRQLQKFRQKENTVLERLTDEGTFPRTSLPGWHGLFASSSIIQIKVPIMVLYLARKDFCPPF